MHAECINRGERSVRVALSRQILWLPKTPDRQGSRLASSFLSNSAPSTSYHKTDPPLSVHESSRLCPARCPGCVPMLLPIGITGNASGAFGHRQTLPVQGVGALPCRLLKMRAIVLLLPPSLLMQIVSICLKD
jgi:hypothetical protein